MPRIAVFASILACISFNVWAQNPPLRQKDVGNWIIDTDKNTEGKFWCRIREVLNLGLNYEVIMWMDGRFVVLLKNSSWRLPSGSNGDVTVQVNGKSSTLNFVRESESSVVAVIRMPNQDNSSNKDTSAYDKSFTDFISLAISGQNFTVSLPDGSSTRFATPPSEAKVAFFAACSNAEDVSKGKPPSQPAGPTPPPNVRANPANPFAK